MEETNIYSKGLWIDVSSEKPLVYSYASNGGILIKHQDGLTICGTNADGCRLNVRGENQDTRINTKPVLDSLDVGDVVLLFQDSGREGGEVWTSDFPRKGDESRSSNARCVPIAIVDYTPERGQMFPPAIGGKANPLIKFGRSIKITKDMLDMDMLHPLLKLSDMDIDHDASIDDVINTFSSFCGEYMSGWNTDEYTPAYQHPGYGRNLASWTSKGLLYLITDAPEEKRRDLAFAMCDWGITLGGAFMDGRYNYANGGHCQGRTALVILAGMLLNIKQLEDPRWMGNVFQERAMHYSDGRKWYGMSTWKSLWQRTSDHRWGAIPLPLDKSPYTWTSNQKWEFNGYYFHACGANIGTAIFMYMMGKEMFIGEDFVRGIVEQFMRDGPEVDKLKERLHEAGLHTDFGKEFPGLPEGPGIQMQAYKILYDNGYF